MVQYTSISFQRGADNIYTVGKLNLASLVNLFNLALHLYTEKLHEVGVPKYDEKLCQELHTIAQTHEVHLNNTNAIK